MKGLAYIFIALVLCTACNTSNQFEITGLIENGQEKSISLNELLVAGVDTISAVKIKKDGSFKIKSSTDIPRFYQLSISKNNFITLLIEPGEKVFVSASVANLNNCEIKGSKGSLLVKKINDQLAETKAKLKSINKKVENLDDSKESDVLFDKLNEEYAQIVDQQRDSSIAFIVTNINSLASIVALYQKYDDKNYVLYKNKDIQYIKIVSESLVKLYPESEHVKTLSADKENLLSKYQQAVSNKKISELVEEMATVANLPEIFLPNVKGDSISLNKTKAKYLLVNFWASWNKESVKRNIMLKDVYKKYHSKGFEIYQVSFDTKKDMWEKAIQFDQLPWINVIDLNGRMSYYARVYNVRELPKSFLVNPEGEVVIINPSKEQLVSTFEYNL